jgi:hypothetical protein
MEMNIVEPWKKLSNTLIVWFLWINTPIDMIHLWYVVGGNRIVWHGNEWILEPITAQINQTQIYIGEYHCEFFSGAK